MDIKAKTSFRVVPEKWSSIDDNLIVNMYKVYQQWLCLNEESMTLSEAEKAWDVLEKWKEHLEGRGLEVPR